MDQRILSLTAVIILILSAGCSGLLPGNNGTPEPIEEQSPTQTQPDTPTPAPTSTPVEWSNSEIEYPTGWAETGVENATAALTAHYRAVLTGPSTTVTYQNVIQSAGSTQTNNTALALKIDTQSQRLAARITGTDTRRELFFANGTLTRWQISNQTVLGRSQANFIRVAQSVDRVVLKSQLLLYTLKLNRTIKQDGTTILFYDITGVHTNSVSQQFGSATTGSGEIIITENGRVLRIQSTVTYTNGTVTYSYTHRQIGETVITTPEWAQRT